MLKKYNVVVIALLIFAPGLAAAAPALDAIADVSPADKSLEFLRYIFGSAVDIIIGGTPSATPDAIIGSMMVVLNTAMMALTGIITAYVGLTGLLNSASEGNPLGKMYDTMWVPLRMTLALFLTIPTGTGFSPMQYGVLWLAGNGIGLANSTWEAALDHMQTNGTLYPPANNLNAEELAKDVLAMRVCMHAINKADQRQNIEEKVSKTEVNPRVLDTAGVEDSIDDEATFLGAGVTISKTFGSVVTSVDYSNIISSAGGIWGSYTPGSGRIKTYQTVQKDGCGSYKLSFQPLSSGTIANDLRAELDELNAGITRAMSVLDVALDPLSRAIVDKSADDTAPNPNSQALIQAIDAYEASVKAAQKTYVQKLMAERTTRSGSNAESGMTNSGLDQCGWVCAGSWYWDFISFNQEVNEALKIEVESDTDPASSVKSNDGYKRAMQSYQSYIANADFRGPTGSYEPGEDRSTYQSTELTSSFYVLEILDEAMQMAAVNPDPISAVSGAAQSTVDAASTAVLISYAAWGTAKAAKWIGLSAPNWPGVAAAATLVAAPAESITAAAFAAILTVVLLLIPALFLLGYYLPSQPLILWIIGVAGWFILVIEAMIAAPIWAASHAFPEGKGFIGQRAQAGYMVILSLTLRPTLMLFGFFASMTLIIVLGKLIFALFLPYMSGMLGQNIAGVASFIALLTIFAMLLVQSAQRAFSLIHEVPDKVLRYIGGGAENLGEASTEQSGRTMFAGAVSRTEHVGKQAKRDNDLKKKDASDQLKQKLNTNSTHNSGY